MTGSSFLASLRRTPASPRTSERRRRGLPHLPARPPSGAEDGIALYDLGAVTGCVSDNVERPGHSARASLHLGSGVQAQDCRAECRAEARASRTQRALLGSTLGEPERNPLVYWWNWRAPFQASWSCATATNVETDPAVATTTVVQPITALAPSFASPRVGLRPRPVSIPAG